MSVPNLISRERAWRLATLAPSGLVYLFLFVAPLSVFFVISFWRVRSFRLRPDFILDNYVEAVGDYYAVLGFTFATALAIATAVTVLGFASAGRSPLWSRRSALALQVLPGRASPGPSVATLRARMAGAPASRRHRSERHFSPQPNPA